MVYDFKLFYFFGFGFINMVVSFFYVYSLGIIILYVSVQGQKMLRFCFYKSREFFLEIFW